MTFSGVPRPRAMVEFLSDGIHRWTAIIGMLPLAGRRVAVLAIGLNVLLGLAPIGFIVGSSALVAAVVPMSDGDAGEWSAFLPALVLTLGTLVLQGSLSPLQAAVGELLTRRTDQRCARHLIRLSCAAPMERLERQDVVEQLSDARAGLVERLTTPGAAVAGVVALVARYTQLAGVVILVVVAVGGFAGTVLAMTALAARFGNRGSMRRWTEISRELRPARRRRRYVFAAAGDPAGAKDVRVFGLMPWLTARADRESRELLTPLWLFRRAVYFKPFLVLTGVVLAGAALVMAQLYAAAISGGMSTFALAVAVQAILVALLFGVFFPDCDVQTQLGWAAYHNLMTLSRSLGANESESVRSDTDTEADSVAATARSRHHGTIAVPPDADVQFSQVDFAYPGHDRQVLRGLDLRLTAGTSTAIVGLNGAGKTTVIKLLAGLYRPSGGRILVGGVDLHDIDLVEWRRRIAMIFQNYIRYELEAAANVAMGAPHRFRPDSADSVVSADSAVWAAARWAGAEEVLAALPDGLDTILSSRYHRGADLSGGQWQRVALARAGYAVQGGACLLVLDEPTAHLDARGEVAFYDQFLRLTRGLTTVVVSHRFSTVRRADQIVVLEDGRVVESGSHAALLGQEGRYARLFRLQARRFGETGNVGDVGDVGETRR